MDAHVKKPISGVPVSLTEAIEQELRGIRTTALTDKSAADQTRIFLGLMEKYTRFRRQ